MKVLIKYIKELLQIRTKDTLFIKGAEMKELPLLKNAYLVIENDIIDDFGFMENCPNDKFDLIIDATNKTVLPAWCDAHTHIVYAGNRVQEFVDKINGLSYEEIANRGGGILNSAQKLNDTNEEQLYQESKKRLEELMKLGTGAIEIKSGYGLSTAGELKMLRVIKQLKKNYPVAIKATFLGAHALPSNYKSNKEAYLNLIIDEMLPLVASENLADFIDVFCESGYFTVKETEQIMKAGLKYGLIPKIHVNQFTSIGGIKASVNHNALSVDHLEEMTDDDIVALQNTKTMPIALPTCSYYLGIPYTPARKMLEAGLPLALASDYNPGSTPSGNMNFVVSTACIKMKMTPEEAINAATLNGAYAMGLEKTHGSITIGKKANLIITKEIPNYAYLPYAFGTNNIDTVIINGEII